MIFPVAALLLGASAAPAPRVAVMPLEVAGVTPELAQSLSGLLPTLVRERLPRDQVIGSDELKTLLSFERQKALLGCTESSCMAELAGALGAAELVTGRIAKVGATWVLELHRSDPQHAKVLGSTVRTFQGDQDAVLTNARSAIEELFPPPPGAAGSSRMPKVLLVSGGVAALAGAGAIGYSVYVHDQFVNQQPGARLYANPPITRGTASAVSVLYPVSIGVAAAGVAAGALGLFGLVRAPAPASVALGPVAGGFAVTVGGEL